MKKTKEKSLFKELGIKLEEEAAVNFLENALAVAVGGKQKTRKLKKLSKKQQNVRSLRMYTRRQIHKKR